MECGAGERVSSGDLGVARQPQESGCGDDYIERLVAVCGGEVPLTAVVSGPSHVATEPDVRTDAALVGDLLKIGVYFGARRKQV